jgi:hypothetical protein
VKPKAPLPFSPYTNSYFARFAQVYFQRVAFEGAKVFDLDGGDSHELIMRACWLIAAEARRFV